MKLPANIDYWHTLETLPYLIADLPEAAQVALKGISSYMVDQRRGRAYARQGKPVCFTIPVWILKKPKDYQLWYVAHEIAHIMDYQKNGFFCGHGEEFHRILYSICPGDSYKYEASYMKRAETRQEKFEMETLLGGI